MERPDSHGARVPVGHCNHNHRDQVHFARTRRIDLCQSTNLASRHNCSSHPLIFMLFPCCRKAPRMHWKRVEHSPPSSPTWTLGKSCWTCTGRPSSKASCSNTLRTWPRSRAIPLVAWAITSQKPSSR